MSTSEKESEPLLHTNIRETNPAHLSDQDHMDVIDLVSQFLLLAVEPLLVAAAMT